MKNGKNTKMRKSFSLIIAISLFVAALNGCADKGISSGKEGQENTEIEVLTTIFPPYDFAKQIVGDKGIVSMLLPPGAESHSYEPSPQDIIKIQNCDVFIFTGGESDKWIENVLESVDTANMKIIRLMDCVETVEEEVSEGMTAEISQKDEHNTNNDIEYDEHVWTSPENAIKITEKISSVLQEVDLKNAEYYQENTGIYVEKLKNLSEEFRSIADTGKRDTIVFGDRFPFRYFVKEYGLKYFAAFPGCSSETEPSVATLAFLSDLVKNEKIPVVFYIESSNHKTADMICEATGAKALRFHSCHNLSKQDMESGITYVEIMEQNAENLKEALS